MIKFPIGKVHNSYIIETYNYEEVKKEIKSFAISLGFDKKLVLEDSHPDIIYVESESKNISIKLIREYIINTSEFTPKISDRKFYIIYDASNLESDTQNAMLKTLEDANSFNTYFLVTSNAYKLLETIRSRCILLKDIEDKNKDDLLLIDYIDDALFMLSNIKNESESDLYKKFISLVRYIIRDAMYYKSTLDKSGIILREKESEIISIANALTYRELGIYVDAITELSKISNLPVNKKIAVFNFYKSIFNINKG